jgi:hypothetical protein
MLKRLLSVLALVAATLFAVHAFADEGKSNMDMKKMNANAAPKATTLKGELVDMGCYLGHGAMGAKHQECATKCVANGMPMGLLTADGKLYLLTLNHDNGDAYNECKTLMAQTVELTGTVATKAGMKGIDVTGVKAAAAK